jgi:hypothetical protein
MDSVPGTWPAIEKVVSRFKVSRHQDARHYRQHALAVCVQRCSISVLYSPIMRGVTCRHNFPSSHKNGGGAKVSGPVQPPLLVDSRVERTDHAPSQRRPYETVVAAASRQFSRPLVR